MGNGSNKRQDTSGGNRAGEGHWMPENKNLQERESNDLIISRFLSLQICDLVRQSRRCQIRRVVPAPFFKSSRDF